jgi:hypothetical protein
MTNSRDPAARDAAVKATPAVNGHELSLAIAHRGPCDLRAARDNVHGDLRRRLPSVDPDNHYLFATLGCGTENLVRWQ